MENIIAVKAESRNEVGKQVAKRIRRENKIPAIIYGGKKDSIPISMDLNDIKNILKSKMGENTILKIKRDDIEVDAMLKDIQYDYLSSTIIHADFIRIDLKKKIEVSVPIVLIGEPIGVRLEDGILDFVNREIDLKCLPHRIPSKIEIDVTDLHIGNSLKFEIIELEEDVEFISRPERVICAVSVKGAVEEEIVEEEEEGLEGEEGVEGEEGAAETSDAEKKPDEASGDKKQGDKKKDDWKKDDKKK